MANMDYDEKTTFVLDLERKKALPSYDKARECDITVCDLAKRQLINQIDNVMEGILERNSPIDKKLAERFVPNNIDCFLEKCSGYLNERELDSFLEARNDLRGL